MWNMVIDIVSIVLSIVLFEQMGLCEAIEKTIGYKFKIISCVRCFSFWSVLLYGIIARFGIIRAISIAFISSFGGVWLQLLFGFLIFAYNNLYSKIYGNE